MSQQRTSLQAVAARYDMPSRCKSMRNGLMIGSVVLLATRLRTRFGCSDYTELRKRPEKINYGPYEPVSKASETLSASQLAVRDVFISSRSWLRFADREVPLPPRGFAPSSCLLQNRQVLLIGDSTVRDLLSWLTDTPRGPWANGGSSGRPTPLGATHRKVRVRIAGRAALTGVLRWRR